MITLLMRHDIEVRGETRLAHGGRWAKFYNNPTALCLWSGMT